MKPRTVGPDPGARQGCKRGVRGFATFVLAVAAMGASVLADAKVQGSGGPLADVVLDHARVERQYRAVDDARRRMAGNVRRNVAQNRPEADAFATGEPD